MSDLICQKVIVCNSDYQAEAGKVYTVLTSTLFICHHPVNP